MPLSIHRTLLQVLYLERFGSPRQANSLRELLGLVYSRGGDASTPVARKTINLLGAAYLADAPSARAVRIDGGADLLISATVAGTINNYRPTDWDDASIVLLTLSSATQINGFDVMSCRRMTKMIVNVGGADLTLDHGSVSSIRDNSILCPGGTDIVLGPSEAAWIVRDPVSARWRAKKIATVVAPAPVNLDFEDPDNSHHIPFVNQ